jgi:hypothetical protein
MNPDTAPVSLTFDPTFPWSIPTAGPVAFLVVAVLLTGLTVWTYHGVRGVSLRRKAVILGLRLAALLVSLLTMLRPAVLLRDEQKLPSVLLVVADGSVSMREFRDEVGGRSRWEMLRRVLDQCEPDLEALRDEQNVTVARFVFAEDVADLTPDTRPDGKRTDFGTMLNTLYERYASERALRGLVILSDGADNGTRFPAVAEAARWKARCPVYTVGLGSITPGPLSRDLALIAVTSEPTPVPVKGKLTVKATIDATGFIGERPEVTVFINGEKVATQEVALTKEKGNEVTIVTDAPATPGEKKLTVRVKPLLGEVSTANNEVTTYITVTKEGVSILYVDRDRMERKFLRLALASDPRFNVWQATRQTDESPAGERDLFQFDKKAYDVVILGDVSARALSGGDPKVLDRLEEWVHKGGGLLMTGGAASFGGDWQDVPPGRPVDPELKVATSPMAALLPVRLDPNDYGVRNPVNGRIQMTPTPAGLKDYRLMHLGGNDSASWTEVWKKLPRLDGMTAFGRPKPGAVVLAETDLKLGRVKDERTGRDQAVPLPILVAADRGKGRTMAFAGDTTWLWTTYGLPKTTEGVDLHAKFWRQMVLWLAHQEDTGTSVVVRPDVRRVPAGGRVGFQVGLKGKTGVELTDAKFGENGDGTVEVLGPDGKPLRPVLTSKAGDEQRGSFWQTDRPGEYTLVAKAIGKDVDGQEVKGEDRARFLVYQDDTELLRPAADHDFLRKLSAAGNGRFLKGEELSDFLKELKATPLPQNRPKLRLWPEWRRTAPDAFPPALLLLFVALIGLEWGLRRWWGLV